MSRSGLQFTGPTFRPVKKWLLSIAFLGLCLGMLGLGLVEGIPLWLQDAGWALSGTFLLGGSVYLLFRTGKEQRPIFGYIDIFPRSWKRWFLDEPVRETKK